MTDKIKYWDDSYTGGDYQKKWQYDQPSQELVSAMACGVIRENGHCLDLGCGTGIEAMYLASRGRIASGIDWSPIAIEIAKADSAYKNLRVDWRIGSVLEMDFEDNTFDFVSDRGCFHHIDDEHRAQYAKELKRVLKPNGMCLLRGCREKVPFANFQLIDETVMSKYFGQQDFVWSPLEAFTMISNFTDGDFPANITLLRK